MLLNNREESAMPNEYSEPQTYQELCDLAQKLNVSRNTIRKATRLSKYPDLISAVENGTIPMGEALTTAKNRNEEAILRCARLFRNEPARVVERPSEETNHGN